MPGSTYLAWQLVPTLFDHSVPVSSAGPYNPEDSIIFGLIERAQYRQGLTVCS